MKSSFLKLAALAAFLSGLVSARAQAPEAPFFASTASLGGTTLTDTWTGLNATNHPGYPTFPGTDAWPAPIAPDAASASGAFFNKINGGGYPASGSIYPFTPGVFSVGVDTALSGLATIVFQINYQNPGSFVSGLSLSYNDGAQNLAANVTFNLVNGASLAGVYQWDVSSFGASVSDFVITWSQPAHGAIQGLQLTQGTAYSNVSAIPEPSTYAGFAGLGVLALAIGRRRRSS